MVQRPELTKTISVYDFQRFYWLKEELVIFCRENNISASGGKIDITNRIVEFLTTGNVTTSVSRVHRPTQKIDLNAITLETLLTKKYTSNETNRAFFKSVIGPHFHFTTRFMNFCKANPDKTYGDAINEWHNEQHDKKDPTYKTELAPQFEYNRFMREFKSAHPESTFQQAVQAWKKHRDTPKL